MTDLTSPSLIAPGPTGAGLAPGNRWEPVALRGPDVERAVDQLVAGPRVDDDLRRVLVVHPSAGSGSGLAPGIQVSIEVLAPGESARPPRRNSSALVVHLRGTSRIVMDGQAHDIGPRDLYSVPPLAAHRHTATGTEPAVRIVFSNAALLELLGAHHVEPVADLDPDVPTAGTDLSVRNDGGAERLGDTDAWRLEYERLVDPPWVPERSWQWYWRDVAVELDRVGALDDRYRGRRVCLLHDPRTGRTNGTTSSLFASLCIRPAGIVDTPHRHTAAAVNYFIEGSGWSTVGGRRIEWSAGDLVFIAPAWTVHHHASGDQPVYQLAVQDNPLHLAMGSLLWQEDLQEPPRLLGAGPGFRTNRHLVEPGTVTGAQP
jgi:gentisate 1,2-dioxygenase